MRYFLHIFTLFLLLSSSYAFEKPLQPFLEKHCFECHDDDVSKADLDLTALGTDLSDAAVFAKWVRVFDRVASGEMPPAKKPRPSEAAKATLAKHLSPALIAAHEQKKGTVLRRLNRHEYENTLNDLFGTNVQLIDSLPPDGRSHEFDVVGEALGISMAHLKQYLNGANAVMDDAIMMRPEKPVPTVTTSSYATGRDSKQFLGKNWLLLDDGAVVFFQQLSYPTGMLRETNMRQRGRYRVRIRGYAYQSDAPITFALGGTSFARGSEKPDHGYFQMQPGAPMTIETEIFSESNYMLSIEPIGIYDSEYKIKKNGIKNYEGPGLAILSVEVEGPLLDEWPSRGHRLLFEGLDRREIMPKNPKTREKSWYKPKFGVVTDDPTADATTAILRVATAAFRRPVKSNEIEAYVELFQNEMNDGSDFDAALRTAVSAIFTSPRFLYLQEQPGRLDAYTLAARLSYFLSRSTPDQTLLQAAADGTLGRDTTTLKQHVDRLMKDARFERFVIDFTDSWLNLREIDFTTPDKDLFPEFDRALREAMLRETRDYFAALVKENLPIGYLVKSDFTIANERLAQHYGIDGVTGPAYRKVPLPRTSVRGGFLGHASVHKVSANGNNSSPVVRGVWVMERILGETPQPPPPGIAGVEPDVRGATTLREILAKHRNVESCASCHQKIDPPGFALEVFNPIGGYREHFRSLNAGEKVSRIVHGRKVRYRKGPPVDASSELPDGSSFATYTAFRDHLAKDERTLARTFVTKLLTFGTGREMGFSDRAEIERITDVVAKKGYGIRDLFYEVVESRIFMTK